MAIKSVNPATEEILKEFQELNEQGLEQAIQKALAAFKVHRLTSFEDRAAKMQKAADILENKKETYAKTMTAEMGKTFKSAISEVEKCALVCRHYADHARDYLAPRHIKTEHDWSYVEYLPIGPVLAVMPWNFPLWQVFRFAAPALMAGNVGLLKHASNVPQCAILIQDVFEEAGFDTGCFQTLLIGSKKVEAVIQDHRIRAVTLTGSEGAGRAVAAQAGEHIKKSVLELGGSDPFIVMPSANLEDALDKGLTGRTMNNGQSCIAAKRFIIHADIYEDFKQGFVQRFENLKVGDPMEDTTDIGPLAMKQGVDDLDDLVEKSVSAGATKICGAHPIDGTGYYYQPGILENIPPNAPAYEEELFGPVALLFKVQTLEEAIELANKTRFGLGAAIFTNDENEMKQAIRDLDAGSTFINHIVASDPRLPFGGVKASGYGRELAAEGIREFTNIKTVVKAA